MHWFLMCRLLFSYFTVANLFIKSKMENVSVIFKSGSKSWHIKEILEHCQPPRPITKKYMTLKYTNIKSTGICQTKVLPVSMLTFIFNNLIYLRPSVMSNNSKFIQKFFIRTINQPFIQTNLLSPLVLKLPSMFNEILGLVVPQRYTTYGYSVKGFEPLIQLFFFF